MKIEEKNVETTYIFTQKELKEKLGIEGNILDIFLNVGVVPCEKNKHSDNDYNITEWGIKTKQDVNVLKDETGGKDGN
jgi:transcription initiation factor IIE alpha subunit